ncbi:MAG: MBL fold metallo-hydrolase [Saprospiraceae bacterium]
MKVIILGTGTSVGVPMIGCTCPTCTSLDPKDSRLRTSAHISTQGIHIQIDIGPDFRQQILSNKIKRVDAILITHQHADHTSGIDEIRAFNFSQNSSIPIYAEDMVLDDLKQRFAYVFSASDYPGLPSIRLNPIIANQNFNILGIDITPLRILHGKLPILGFRICNFAYITDASQISEDVMQELQGLEVLIINALRHKVHHSHFNLDQSLKVVHQINAKQTYLTHLSHQMGLHKDIEKELPPNVFLGYDGLTIEIND